MADFPEPQAAGDGDPSTGAARLPRPRSVPTGKAAPAGAARDDARPRAAGGPSTESET